MYIGHAEVTYVLINNYIFLHYVIFCSSVLVGLLHDLQILHINIQIFQFRGHDVLKVQVY